MKIGVSTTSVEPSRNGGLLDGIGHYTQHLCEGLAQAGQVVHGFSFPGFRQIPDQLRHTPMPASFAQMAGTAIASFGIAPRFTPDVDIFHSTDFKVVPMNVPVVATVWDAIPLLHPEWLSQRARLFAPAILKRMVPYADRIIVASEHSRQDVERHFGIPTEKMSVVPWGIGSEWFAPFDEGERDVVLHKYGLEPGYFLTVSTIQPRKNIAGLLDAYETLSSERRAAHKLVIVGRFGWGEDGLLERLNTLQQSKNIVWLQNVASDYEVRALYAGARAFVFLSLYEGFGIPLLEAFASNVPVITSNRTSLPEVSAKAAIELDPLDIKAIGEAMEVLATDADVRARHVDAGRKRAAYLTIAQSLSATISVYEQVLGERQSV